MAIHTGNEKTASRIRAKAGTITTVLLLAGVVTAAVVSATPGPRPEVEENERSKAAEHAKGADRDGKPSKADMDARKAAFLDGLDAKVEAGELTQAEADEMIARMRARIAEHAKQIDRPSKAA